MIPTHNQTVFFIQPYTTGSILCQGSVDFEGGYLDTNGVQIKPAGYYSIVGITSISGIPHPQLNGYCRPIGALFFSRLAIEDYIAKNSISATL